MAKSIALFVVATLGTTLGGPAAVAVAQQRATPPPTAGGSIAGSTHVEPATLPAYAAELQKQIAVLQAENRQQAHVIVLLVKEVSGLSQRFAHHQHHPDGKCFVAKPGPGDAVGPAFAGDKTKQAILDAMAANDAKQKQEILDALAGKPDAGDKAPGAKSDGC